MPVQFCKLFPGILLFRKLTQTAAISYKPSGFCEPAAKCLGYDVSIFLLKRMQISLVFHFIEPWKGEM